jgi:hypothetical protein
MTTSGTKTAASKYDPNFTRNVINAIGPNATPRMRSVMSSLIQHLHDFARENEITVEEWMAGVTLVCVYKHSELYVPMLIAPDERGRPNVHRCP